MSTSAGKNYILNVLLEKAAYCIIILGFLTGCLVVYGWNAVQLGDTPTNEIWNPISLIGTILHCFIVILIVLSKFYYYKFRLNFSDNDMENPEILYLLYLPITIFVVVIWFVEFMKDVYSECSLYGNICFDISGIVLFVSTIIQITQNQGLYTYGEVYLTSLVNMIRIGLTIVTQVYFIAFGLFWEQTQIFLKILNNPIIQTDCVGNKYSFSDLRIKFLPYVNKCIVISGMTSSIFLWIPFVKHYYHLQRLKSEAQIDNKSYVEHSETSKSVSSYIFGFLMAALLISITILMLAMQPDYGANLRYIYCSFTILSYILMIWFSVKQLQTIKMWNYQSVIEKRKIFNEIFVWLGLAGQLFNAFAMIGIAIYNFKNEETLSFMVILTYSTQVCQNMVQSVFESTLLEKEWRRPQKNRFTIFIFGMVFLGMHNFAFGVINWMLTDFTLLSTGFASIPHPFPIRLFSRLLNQIGVVAGILQRFHSSIIFFEYLRFIR